MTYKETRFLISCNLGTGILSALYWNRVLVECSQLFEWSMTLTNFWISIPKVSYNDNKAFFLIDMKVATKIPWPQLYGILKFAINKNLRMTTLFEWSWNRLWIMINCDCFLLGDVIIELTYTNIVPTENIIHWILSQSLLLKFKILTNRTLYHSDNTRLITVIDLVLANLRLFHLSNKII
jgi:hypothetical protein